MSDRHSPRDPKYQPGFEPWFGMLLGRIRDRNAVRAEPGVHRNEREPMEMEGAEP